MLVGYSTSSVKTQVLNEAIVTKIAGGLHRGYKSQMQYRRWVYKSVVRNLLWLVNIVGTNSE